MIANPIDTAVRYLCLALFVIASVGWGCAMKYRGDALGSKGKTEVAQTREAQAIQGTADASAGQDLAIGLANDCAKEDARVDADNNKAVKDAYNAGLEEGKRAEKYYSDLENAGDECAAITQVQVCDALYPY